MQRLRINSRSCPAFASLALLLAHSLCSLFVVASQCHIPAPYVAVSDPVEPTWIFNWSNDPAFVKAKDLQAAVIAALNSSSPNFQEENQNALCDLYNDYFVAKTPAERERIENELKHREVDLDMLAGHGMYFARSPFESRSYGSYLLAIAVPRNKKFGAFLGKSTAILNMTQLILSPYEGIVYPWYFNGPAVVLRGISPILDDLKIHAETFNFSLPASGTQCELHKQELYPSFGHFSWRSFMLHYLTVTSFMGFINRSHEFIWPFSNGTASKDGVIGLLTLEWSRKCYDSNSALLQLFPNEIEASKWRQEIILTLPQGQWTLPWEPLVKLFVLSDYADETAFAIPPGDVVSLNDLLVKHYTKKGGVKIALDVYRGCVKMLEQRPSLNTWTLM